MSKISKTLFCSFLALIVIVIGNYVIVAQNTLTGVCRADVRADKTDKPDKIQLSFSRETERGGKNNMSSSFAYSDLKGLTREQALAGGQIRFSLEREAGTVVCDANFAGGKGTGTFTFTANQSFVDAMRTRGFDFEKNEGKYNDEDNVVNRLFAATTLNVTTALADDLLSANFGKLDTGDLFKAAIFKVDGKFAREMKDSGFQNLTFEDLVKARIFKIDAEYVRNVASMGFQNEPFESLVKMKIFKITPEFISEVRSEGFQNLEIEQLVKMKIFNINAEFIRQARSEGVPMEVEKLVQKRIGVYRVKKDDF
jgi:hypothetical protein